jgi:hypothetical protein
MPKILRLPETFGPRGKIPVKHTKAYDDFIYHPGGERNITGTNIPRLRRVNLGPRAIGFIDTEVDAVVAALAARRDTALASE